MDVKFANSDADIARCFPVMFQLRPHLTQAKFINRVKHQQEAGYFLIYLEVNNIIKAVAGFRILDMLANGKLLYIDDLVTDELERSQGYGNIILDWLVDCAKTHNCLSLQLDSGVQRSQAHKFYFKNSMQISAFHFSLNLSC